MPSSGRGCTGARPVRSHASQPRAAPGSRQQRRHGPRGGGNGCHRPARTAQRTSGTALDQVWAVPFVAPCLRRYAAAAAPGQARPCSSRAHASAAGKPSSARRGGGQITCYARIGDTRGRRSLPQHPGPAAAPLPAAPPGAEAILADEAMPARAGRGERAAAAADQLTRRSQSRPPAARLLQRRHGGPAAGPVPPPPQRMM